MSVHVGFRIEFYDQPGGRLVGSVYIEDAFCVSAVPRPDDRIAVNCLAGGTAAGSWWPGSIPFERVTYLEHHPVPVGSDDQPGVVAVIRTTAPSGSAQAATLVGEFGLAGWTVDAFGPPSPLSQAVQDWHAEH